jgi:CHAT domain-containing protein
MSNSDDRLGNGAEILGFGYLMQQVGALAAIASLWQVSDGGTQILMDGCLLCRTEQRLQQS